MDHSVAFRLPCSFDIERLQTDLRNVESEFSSGRSLSVLSLYSPGGNDRVVDTAPRDQPYEETSRLARMPYIREVIAAFPAPKYWVRLACLMPESEIGEHRDTWVGFHYGIVRVHVPIACSPEVRFIIAERTYHFAPGETWFGDFCLPHRVLNPSRQQRRVHLVLDLGLTPELLSLFPSAFLEARRSQAPFAMAQRSIPFQKSALRELQGRATIPRRLLPLKNRDGAVSALFRRDPARGVLLEVLSDGVRFQLVAYEENSFGILGAGPGLRFSLEKPGRARTGRTKLRIRLAGGIWINPVTGEEKPAFADERYELEPAPT